MRSFFPCRHWLACLAITLATGSLTAQQQGYTAPEQDLSAALESLTTRAADIFTGQVVAVERKNGVVEVTFTVGQALQGHAAGSYVLREWAGLWPQGQFRYVVGQRALLFVLPASAAGLSSPVDGAEGVLPLLPTTADGPMLVDARRLDARLLRAIGQPLPDDRSAGVNLEDVVQVIRSVQAPPTDGTGARRHLPPPRRLPLQPGPEGPWTPIDPVGPSRGQGGDALAQPVYTRLKATPHVLEASDATR